MESLIKRIARRIRDALNRYLKDYLKLNVGSVVVCTKGVYGLIRGELYEVMGIRKDTNIYVRRIGSRISMSASYPQNYFRLERL